MSNKQITTIDIAKKLNLHYTTVAKALRNHPDISQKTKKVVLAAAKELDYHPNNFARGLRSRRSQTIGVIVPSIKNDFFSTVISGIEEAAYKNDFTIIVSQSNEDRERELVNIRNMVSNHVAGLLICISAGTRSGSHLEVLQKRKIPFAFFDRVCDDIQSSKVKVDDYRGAFEAVEYLISTGRRRIAHFAGPEYISVSRDRRRGYLDALKKHGIPIDEDWIVFGEFQDTDGKNALRKLLSINKVPDAIFAVNDPVAFGAYQVAKDNEMRIPEDLAVVGFGDNSFSPLLEPPLTTVVQSPFNLGQTAAQILMRHIIDENHPFEQITLSTELILRKSA